MHEHTTCLYSRHHGIVERIEKPGCVRRLVVVEHLEGREGVSKCIVGKVSERLDDKRGNKMHLVLRALAGHAM